MSLLHADFPSGQVGLYGTTTTLLLNGVYSEYDASRVTLVDDPSPTITGNVIRSGNPSSFVVLRKSFPSSGYTFGGALRLWMNQLPAATTELPRIIEMRNVANVVMCSFRIETDGRVSALRGTATVLGTSTAPFAVANAWQHWEWKFFADAATGTVEIRCEGQVVLALTAQNTLAAAGPITQWAIYHEGDGSSALNFYVKDLIMWDNAGTVNNTFFGSVAVYEMIPSADVSFNWTPSTGTTGWNLIDEAPPNDDTDYIAAANPAPAASKFDLTDLPVDVVSVRGLMVVNRSEKTDGGDGNLQVGLVSGASTVLGSDRPLTTTYTYWRDIFELDPATAAAWTRTAANAAKLQLNRTV